jgi:hypothetical protein
MMVLKRHREWAERLGDLRGLQWNSMALLLEKKGHPLGQGCSCFWATVRYAGALPYMIPISWI